MRLNYRIITLVIGLSILLYTHPLYASNITSMVKSSIDEVLMILNDKSLKGHEKTRERRAKIRNIVKERFDFEEMARRSLGIHWRERTEREKEEFITLFSSFLEASYIDRIEAYSDEDILYVGEITDKDRALVKTMVVTKGGTEIPIHYRLFKRGDWKVYDVVIEGVSLVSNYRSQFNEIVQRSSYEELIKRLKSKVEEKGS